MKKDILNKKEYMQIRQIVENCVFDFMNPINTYTLDYYINKYNIYEDNSKEKRALISLAYFPDSIMFFTKFKMEFKNNVFKMAKFYKVPCSVILERLYLIDFCADNFDIPIDNIYNENEKTIFQRTHELYDNQSLEIANNTREMKILEEDIDQAINMANKRRF